MTQPTARLPLSAQLLPACLLTILLVLLATFQTLEAAGANDVIEGVVGETMDAAGYTYVSVATAAGPVWVAIPETKIAKGATLSFAPGMEMRDFHSKSLNKTFPSIIFSEGIVDGSAPSAHGLQAAASSAPAEDPFAAAVQAEKSGGGQQVQPPQGSGGSMGALHRR